MHIPSLPDDTCEITETALSLWYMISLLVGTVMLPLCHVLFSLDFWLAACFPFGWRLHEGKIKCHCQKMIGWFSISNMKWNSLPHNNSTTIFCQDQVTENSHVTSLLAQRILQEWSHGGGLFLSELESSLKDLHKDYFETCTWWSWTVHLTSMDMFPQLPNDAVGRDDFKGFTGTMQFIT